MVLEEVLLLPKPCSTRNAARRSDGLSPRGTCTTPDSLSPAEGKVTACSVMAWPSIATVSVRGGPGSAVHRFALHRIRDTNVTGNVSEARHCGAAEAR